MLAHLRADSSYQRHTLRFVENHDEPRLAALLGPGAQRAVAITAATLPGVALVHEGQADGRRVHHGTTGSPRLSLEASGVAPGR